MTHGQPVAARASKGWEVQRIKPRVALPLRAVEVECIAAANLAVEQGRLVERRRSIAVLQASTPIANGRQGPLDEAARARRPMRNPVPTAVRGLRVDCGHISTPNATEIARELSTRSCAGDVQWSLMLQTRVSQPRLRDFHAVTGCYLPPLGALRAFEAAAGLMSFSKAAENEPISTACTNGGKGRIKQIAHFRYAPHSRVVLYTRRFTFFIRQRFLRERTNAAKASPILSGLSS